MPQAQRGSDPKIAYLDLFAGPGRYKDGTKSTPLLILEKTIQDEMMSEMLVTVFKTACSGPTLLLYRARCLTSGAT